MVLSCLPRLLRPRAEPLATYCTYCTQPAYPRRRVFPPYQYRLLLPLPVTSPRWPTLSKDSFSGSAQLVECEGESRHINSDRHARNVTWPFAMQKCWARDTLTHSRTRHMHVHVIAPSKGPRVRDCDQTFDEIRLACLIDCACQSVTVDSEAQKTKIKSIGIFIRDFLLHLSCLHFFVFGHLKTRLTLLIRGFNLFKCHESNLTQHRLVVARATTTTCTLEARN